MTTVKFTLTVEVPGEAAPKAEGLLRDLAEGFRAPARLTRVEYEEHPDYRIETSRRTLRKIDEGS